MKTEIIALSAVGVTPTHVYEAMGYRGVLPDPSTIIHVDQLLASLEGVVTPSYSYCICSGELGEETLTIDGVRFDMGRSITALLKGSERFAVCVVTAGEGFDRWFDSIRAGGDIMQEFVADAIGSAITIQTGVYLEKLLMKRFSPDRISNSCSPGHCKWHVSQQKELFSLLGEECCGITLTDSFLMHPVKSASTVLGIGRQVRRVANTCMLCPLTTCFRRNTDPNRI